MQAPITRPPILRFGVFEVDLQAEELRKSGVRIKLPRQSLYVLRALLERPGELVTREELHQTLWPANTFVDFDRGLNAAVTRLRDALGDSADSPRFIETLPRRGYRFIGQLHSLDVVPSPKPLTPRNGSSGTAPGSQLAPKQPLGSRNIRLIAALAIAAVLIAAAVTLILNKRPGQTQTQGVTVTPFTSLPGQEINPSFSPDGTRIVFAWDGDPLPGRKGFDLYIKEIGSEHLLRLTRNPSRTIFPVWSPDGRFIVFSRSADEGKGIYTISALGGEERLLKQVRLFAGEYNGLSLSADGRYLAYPEISQELDLYRVALLDMQTMEPVSVSLPDCIISGFPAFAPTSNKLAFACTPTWGISDIYVIPEIGGTPHMVTRIYGFPVGLTWLNDGRSLIMGANRGFADLWRIEEATGKSEPLLFGAAASNPTVSQNGNLAFAQRIDTANIWRFDLENPGKPAERFLPSTRFEQNATYSPDGKYVLFESTRSGFNEIWMSQADGSNVVQLTHFQGPLTGTPHWAPDGRRFVFDSRAEGHSNLYIMDVNERVPRKVEMDVADASTASFSPDGRLLYFRCEAPGQHGIYKVPSSGGKATLLSHSEGYGPLPTSDGNELYYSVGMKESRVHRLSLKTGAEALVAKMPLLDNLIAWALTPNGIYFLQPGAESVEVMLYSLQDGDVRKIGDLPRGKDPTPFVGGLTVFPDGHSLLYSQIEEKRSDIMLVENFR